MTTDGSAIYVATGAGLSIGVVTVSTTTAPATTAVPTTVQSDSIAGVATTIPQVSDTSITTDRTGSELPATGDNVGRLLLLVVMFSGIGALLIRRTHNANRLERRL